MDQLGFDSHPDTMLSPFRQSTPDRLIAISRSQLIRLREIRKSTSETVHRRIEIRNLHMPLTSGCRRECDMDVTDRGEGLHRRPRQAGEDAWNAWHLACSRGMHEIEMAGPVCGGCGVVSAAADGCV
jgi:hypothetical protein